MRKLQTKIRALKTRQSNRRQKAGTRYPYLRWKSVEVAHKLRAVWWNMPAIPRSKGGLLQTEEITEKKVLRQEWVWSFTKQKEGHCGWSIKITGEFLMRAEWGKEPDHVVAYRQGVLISFWVSWRKLSIDLIQFVFKSALSQMQRTREKENIPV